MTSADVMSSRYSNSCGKRDLLERAALLDPVAFFAFVAQIAARLDAARAFAQERHGEAFAQRVVVDAHRGGVEDLDRMRRVVRVEDRDREIVAVDDLDRADHERVLGREELVPALIARAHFVEHAVRDETVEDLAERRDRRQGLGPVAASVDDLQGEGAGLRLISAWDVLGNREAQEAGKTRCTRPGRNPSFETMLSIPDMAILGAAALLFFGPEQLPRVARKAGNVMREIQNTSQSFIREMERAADIQDVTASRVEPPPYEPAAYDPVPYDAAARPDAGETAAEPYAAEPYRPEPVYESRNGAPHAAAAYEPPAPDPETPLRRSAPPPSAAAEPPPETDHPANL